MAIKLNFTQPPMPARKRYPAVVALLTLLGVMAPILAGAASLPDKTHKKIASLVESGTYSDALKQSVNDADWVATVTVQVVQDLLNPTLSSQGRFASDGVRYGVIVEQLYKGEPNPATDEQELVYFSVPLQVCYHYLQRGGQYLLVATQNSRGQLSVAGCQAMVPVPREEHHSNQTSTR